MQILSPAFLLNSNKNVGIVDESMPVMATGSAHDHLIVFSRLQNLDLTALDVRIRSGKLSVAAPVRNVRDVELDTLWISETLALPHDADVDQSSALIDDDCLVIVLPRSNSPMTASVAPAA